MAQLVKNDDIFTATGTYTIEGGSGTVVFYPDTDEEHTMRIENLSLPLICPSSLTLRVLGSSILFYVNSATPTNPLASGNVYDGVRTGEFQLTESHETIITGGKGKFRYVHTNSGEEVTNILVDASDLNYPIIGRLDDPAGTNTIDFIPQGSHSFLLTTDAASV